MRRLWRGRIRGEDMNEHEGCENCARYVPENGYRGKCHLDSANPRTRDWNNWCRFWKYGYIPPKVPRRAYPADAGRGEMHYSPGGILEKSGERGNRAELEEGERE